MMSMNVDDNMNMKEFSQRLVRALVGKKPKDCVYRYFATYKGG